MVAAYSILYSTGGSNGSPSWTALPGGGGTSFRFHTSVSVAEDLVNPIPIPAAGFNYSFWVAIALHVTGTYTQVNNIRQHSDGTISWNLGAAGALNVGSNSAGSNGLGLTDAQYIVPSGTIGTSGDEIVANHATVDQAINIQTYNNATNALVLDTVNYGPNATFDSKHSCLQVKCSTVGDGALQGVQGSEQVTVLADEI